MPESSTDSQRAWQLLISRIEATEKAVDRSDERDEDAWREYRRKCEAYDKALASLRADIEALKSSTEAAFLKAQLKTKPGVNWERLIPLIASGVAMVIATWGKVGSIRTSNYVRGWRRPHPVAVDTTPRLPAPVELEDSMP